jgi:hypothetical protein
MQTQTITWTALPNGVTTFRGITKLSLSVFVSPRLQTYKTSPTLSLFPDFLDWPGTLFPSDSENDVTFYGSVCLKTVQLHAQEICPVPIYDSFVFDATTLERTLYPDTRPAIHPIRQRNIQAS